MGWLAEMQRDAVAVMDPEFTLHDDDEVELHVNIEPGYHLSDNSWLDPYLALTVSARRGGRLVLSKTVEGPDAVRAWEELMERGSEREELERAARKTCSEESGSVRSTGRKDGRGNAR